MILDRLAKVRAMSAREILHRLVSSAAITVERQLYKRGAFSRADRLRTALRPEISKGGEWERALLERRASARLFAWQDDPSGFLDVFRSDYRAEHEKARAVAGPVLRHQIGFFGEVFDLGPDVRWHADPVSGAEWPRRFHHDVPCGRSTGCGDVKHVWELNRHQFLMDLAKVALLDGSAVHATELLALLDSWSKAAPYGTGTPWACALEPAFRVWSWLWAYPMLTTAGLLPEAAHLRWLTGFYDHGHFLHRHLEYYKSPYNHLIGEASALFALGLAFPEFAEASAWVQRGRDVLEGTVSDQFHADGGTVEQSTFYHHATLGFYILSAVLGRRHGQELDPRVWSAIERAIEFSIALVQPDGRLPTIGGADDGKPIRLEHLPFWDFRPYYAIGAVLFRRPDFKGAASRFWEDALWVLGPQASAEFAHLSSSAPPASQSLPASGYSVFRTGREETADYLLFDCGPQAGGLRRDGVPSAAHGHADCLSIIATLGGQRVLVDPGFFCYNGEPAWEVHFRKTPAHNTIWIDGRDQARHVSKMVWTHTYTPTLEGIDVDGTIGWARGTHDGYLTRPGVHHRRSVWLRPDGYLLVLDELSGRPGAVAYATFQFAPGVLDAGTEGQALFENRFELAWSGSVPVRATVRQGGAGPADGWIAPSLGVRVAAPRLILALTLTRERVLLLSVLSDRLRGADPSRRRTTFVEPAGGPVLAAQVAGPGWTDHVVASAGGAAVERLGMATDAVLAVGRLPGTRDVDVHRIGGSFARFVAAATTHLETAAGDPREKR